MELDLDWLHLRNGQRRSSKHAASVMACHSIAQAARIDAGLPGLSAVVSANPKSLPSTSGHRTMNGHPFFDGRIGQANQNLAEAMHALSDNDFELLSSIAEYEALTLHALIMSANPGTLLMKPATVEVIHRVRDARKSGLPLFFTLDAGANVHVMYPTAAAVSVEKYIADALQPLCEEGRVIFDGCGEGPVCLIPQPLLPREKGSIPSP